MKFLPYTQVAHVGQALSAPCVISSIYWIQLPFKRAWEQLVENSCPMWSEACERHLWQWSCHQGYSLEGSALRRENQARGREHGGWEQTRADCNLSMIQTFLSFLFTLHTNHRPFVSIPEKTPQPDTPTVLPGPRKASCVSGILERTGHIWRSTRYNSS